MVERLFLKLGIGLSLFFVVLVIGAFWWHAFFGIKQTVGNAIGVTAFFSCCGGVWFLIMWVDLVKARRKREN